MSEKLRGLKESRLRKKCGVCQEGVFNNGAIQLLEVDVTVHLVDPHAIRRQVGLEMQMGGAAALAQHMGPDEDMTKPAYKLPFLMCQECACKQQSLMQILENINNRESERDLEERNKEDADEQSV